MCACKNKVSNRVCLCFDALVCADGCEARWDQETRSGGGMWLLTLGRCETDGHRHRRDCNEELHCCVVVNVCTKLQSAHEGEYVV